ncbi:hypothetical protein Goari_021962, partial [Gossypium aridum]|nr:hypothetical protein [Gossypium aridum]
MDLERVINGSPWTFNKHLLLFHRLGIEEDPLKVPFIYVWFWVQVHDIPPKFFSEVLARQLGNFIRHFVKYDGHSDYFYEERMSLGFEIAEIGWYLSIR